jgi:hypothetical protein
MLRKFLCTATILAIAPASHAICTQTNNTVGFLGLDNANGRIYVNVSGHSNQCGCSHFRFDPQATDTDMALSLLLSARMAGMKVRVDVSEQGACDAAFRVYIQ